MKKKQGKDFEVTTDGVTVWVNDSTGMCIGRFGPRGIDIHASFEAQLKGEHCLFCKAAENRMQHFGTAADFRLFILKMEELHGVHVPPHTRVEVYTPARA